jgi:tRNA pseudouridine32 synthase / 23S rRNA pseudouridine746 synthase
MLGDGLYAPEDVLAKAPRLLLHAQELWLDHPITGVEVRVQAAPDF